MVTLVRTDAEARLAFLKQRSADIMVCYRDALDAGMDTPVVWVTDIRDPLGRIMAEGLVGKEFIQRALAKAAELPESRPVYFKATPYGALESLLDLASFSDMPDIRQRPADETVLAIAVVHGGTAALVLHSDKHTTT